LNDFAPYLLPLSPSFNDDFEQNTIGKRWGAKSHIKKEGVQNRTISKRYGGKVQLSQKRLS